MNKFPGLPDELWQHGAALCVELTDWTGPEPGPAWVNLAEAILATLEVSPKNGFAHSGDLKNGRIRGPETRGSWQRIRGRASKFLGTHAGRNAVDVNTGYDFRIGESNRNAYVVIRTGTYFPIARREVAIAVSTDIASSPDAILQRIGGALRDNLQPNWGGVFQFPAAAGADFYLGNGGYTGPEVRSLGSFAVVLAEHEKRLLRVKHRSSTEFSFGAGYVREVYEINFFSENHLRAPILGASVREYASSVGKLTPSKYWPDLHEWRLDEQDLARARRDWEESGLVLAAEREPFRWQ